MPGDARAEALAAVNEALRDFGGLINLERDGHARRCVAEEVLDAIPAPVLARLAIERGGLEQKVEWCRKCRDELPYGSPSVRAEFIPWGRLFDRGDLVGPCCLNHLPKSIRLDRLDQYAVLDMRPLYRLNEEDGGS